MLLRFTLLAAGAACLALGWPALAEARPRICLALSGGGARGISHIGVLKVLEARHIPIDCIAGTSMGAIVGGLYASGYSAAELETMVTDIHWSEMFDDRPPRRELSEHRREEDFDFPWSFEMGYGRGEFRLPSAAVGGVGFERLLARLTDPVSDIMDFDRLPIPFRAVATDMVSGKRVVFSRGKLVRVLRASMSVPGAFSPVELDGQLLGDGGLTDNLPVDVARSMGADVVIAVNIGTPLASRKSLDSVVGVTMQMINILTEQNVREQLASLKESDLLITPDLKDITFLDFQRGAAGIEAGETAALRQSTALAALALPAEEWGRYLAARPRPEAITGTLDFVRIQGVDDDKTRALMAKMKIEPGQTIDGGALRAQASRMMGSGNLERVDYTLMREGDQQGVVFNVKQKSWGPNFFRTGFSIATDFAGSSSFDLLLGHRLAWINEWGGEWRNRLQLGRTRGLRTELIQPLGPGAGIFIAPKVEIERRTLDVYQGDQRIAQWQSGFNRAGVDFGIPLWTYGELRLGVASGRLVADQSIGTLNPSRISFNESGVTGSLSLDQLDDAAFPRSGWRLTGEFFNSRSDFSSQRDYTRWQATGLVAWSEGVDTWQAGLELGGFMDRSRIGYSNFRLGGFQRLSGYLNDQIDGNYLALGKVVYRRRMAEITPFGRALYVGGSFETGNAWADRNQVSWSGMRHAGSLFIAADTPLGPAYLGFGAAGGGQRAIYLFLGRP